MTGFLVIGFLVTGFLLTRGPGDRVPGDRVPGDRVPGDRVPSDRVSECRTAMCMLLVSKVHHNCICCHGLTILWASGGWEWWEYKSRCVEVAQRQEARLQHSTRLLLNK